MNDDELKKLWQQQPLRTPDVSPEQLVSAMQKQTTQLRRTLDARDLRELAACAFVIIIFGIFYFTVYRTPISRLGDLIVIGSSIFVAWKLIHTRRKTPPAPPGSTVVESLQAELNAVRAQSQLLGSVLWWYLLPLGVGILVCTWGNAGGGLVNNIGNIVYTVFVIALYAFIHRLNQQARAKQLLPLEVQLESLIHSAQTGEPLAETHVANLRPIVLSMAAANHVRPAEFKVAFWQLAIFGVPGIVGIWFFLMIGLTDWNIKPQIPKTFVQSVEETNRYSIVARKVVDLLNAGDYATVYKLYNPEMSKAFPPKETSEYYTRIAVESGKIEKFDVPPRGYRGWILFQLHCQRGEWTMNLALDADDRISGISFQPVVKRSENIKSYVLRLFSPLHLILIVPFFLAGLLYSKLIQKTTERAVGISTLGIHLCKGQTLILWDEIKEVRPFKFLHVRNLWLIKESGEKTLMHWTPLERHSELEAAVESFAPANHPIRKFLSLLRPEPSRKAL
jgi:hypothetical protein